MMYSPPSIPTTPSTSINSQLNKRFSQPADNLLKSIIAHLICAIFYSINVLTDVLQRTKYFAENPSKEQYSKKQAWNISCMVVPLSLILSTFVIYMVIIASSYLVEAAIVYFLGTVAFFVVCIGVSGVIFYDSPAASNKVE